MRISGNFRLTAFRIISVGFALLILTGTWVLSLPASRRHPGPANLMDCLFTSVSAVCVTGLVVQDTATYFTFFGQIVILILIQLGGMGVGAVAASLAFLSRRKIGLMQRSMMRESISAPQLGGVVHLTLFSICAALGMELLGALLLTPSMISCFGLKNGLFYAVFHSVSAFCNAGFDLMGIQEHFSSLTGFSQNIGINLTIILLITIGGFGFLVLEDIRHYRLNFRHYRLQSKLVLLTSLSLAVIPAILFYLTELQEIPRSARILPALFQSVTLRTAGFNTVDLNRFSKTGQVLMICLMLTGGSPGSTAGGMKTTTFAVLVMNMISVFGRKDGVTVLGRRLSDETVRSASAIFMVYTGLFLLGGMLISGIEQLPLLSCLFESASAVGTVGLSLGITANLTTSSRLILIALMFLGRVGCLTLFYAARPEKRNSECMLPLENVAVG